MTDILTLSPPYYTVFLRSVGEPLLFYYKLVRDDTLRDRAVWVVFAGR